MDPIDRQTAINAIYTEGTRLERNGTAAMAEIKQWCIDILKALPPAQSEIIRCKDCKHNSLNRKSGNTYCNLGIGLYQLDDYCSYGERRKVDGD